MVPRQRVLVLGLDGLEITLAERLMAAGEMPALEALRRRAARFRLDHGAAQRTGLAWEHVASGLSPEAGRRWAAVEFDPATYVAWQEGARFTPWWTSLDRRVTVFDTPYVDLGRAKSTRGVVGWGAHDPGTVTAARPHGLLAEFKDRFGRYPAANWTYGLPWPSPARTRAMGEELSRALEVRSHAARWLATERLPDWDLFIAVAGETHGAIEGLWHGVDPSHPLHGHPSAAPAARAMRDVHRALDAMLGHLVAVAGDAPLVVFSMGGMGPNHSDVPTMVLLPELLYRHAFGHPWLALPSKWTAAPGSVPVLDEDESWSEVSEAWVPMPATKPDPASSAALLALARRLPVPVRSVLKGVRAAVGDWRSNPTQKTRRDLLWQPAQRYRDHWARMPAFALPSFYDGRIRINLKGRERHGMVEPSRYEENCRDLEALLRQCRNPRTGEPVVDSVERPSTRDPLALTGSEADLLVVWRGVIAAFEHPRLGLIGPVPLRRTGGHTGRHGMAYIAAPGLQPGDRGERSAFDVIPTIVKLLGSEPPAHLSGTSLL
ncbi:MAG TPA: alkaline phosphatase family protein [Methylomirabilota bacterium]|nr:alkaline phosphatase family protein [Methylomirabilota bacterium]